jgi:AcrR family transcriptional regulator
MKKECRNTGPSKAEGIFLPERPERQKSKFSGLTSRQIRARTTKKQIFDTAVALIKKQGYEKTAIKDICRKTGVSIGVFYYYYRGKQEILNELYLRADLFLQEQFNSWVVSSNPVERVKEYLALYIHFVGLEGVDMALNIYYPANRLFLYEDRYMLIRLEELIREGQEEGSISRKFTPQGWTRYIFTVLRGVAFDWALRSGEYSIEEGAQAHIECLASYLRS